MSSQSKLMRAAVTLFASVLVSTVAVGTAVGPAHAVANPGQAYLHA